MKRECIARCVISAAAFSVVSVVSAAELRPFVLPSQTSPSPAAQQQSTGVSNAFYENFAREVAQVDQKKIDSLRNEFKKRLDQAKSDRRYDERAHYERMIGILEVYKEKRGN